MKAVSLISGGLDSLLATRIVSELGIELVGVHFVTPFTCSVYEDETCRLQSLLKNFDLEIKIVYLKEEYIEMVKNPKYGYGKNLNPCIDCKILMLKYAKEIMDQVNASFIVTGEVVGQRPMSQNVQALKIIEKETKLEGLILRPLSAKVLPQTLPELNHWIDRSKLFGITGRQRKIQIELAKTYGIKDYPTPSGGCLLTVPSFAVRLNDLLLYSKDITLFDINLLKIGRHFRLDNTAKVVIGRNEQENKLLSSFEQQVDVLLIPLTVAGPTGIGIGKFNPDKILLFANILATYTDAKTEQVMVLERKTNVKIVASKLAKTEVEKFKVY